LIYPIPTAGTLRVQGFSQGQTAAICSVFSVDGKQVDVDVLNNHTLDAGRLDSGIYFVHIAAEEGTSTIRFEKE
jgi:hypothetical protein